MTRTIHCPFDANAFPVVGLGPPGRDYEVCARSDAALAAYLREAKCWTVKTGPCKAHAGRTHYRVMTVAGTGGV
jgi:hypothetical protein